MHVNTIVFQLISVWWAANIPVEMQNTVLISEGEAIIPSCKANTNHPLHIEKSVTYIYQVNKSQPLIVKNRR